MGFTFKVWKDIPSKLEIFKWKSIFVAAPLIFKPNENKLDPFLNS
jgi:hypothetical protein